MSKYTRSPKAGPERSGSRSCSAASSLTLTCPFIRQKFVAFLAAALEGAHRIPAEVVAAAVVLQAFVNVWEREKKKKKQTSRKSEKKGNTAQKCDQAAGRTKCPLNVLASKRCFPSLFSAGHGFCPVSILTIPPPSPHHLSTAPLGSRLEKVPVPPSGSAEVNVFWITSVGSYVFSPTAWRGDPCLFAHPENRNVVEWEL